MARCGVRLVVYCRFDWIVTDCLCLHRSVEEKLSFCPPKGNKSTLVAQLLKVSCCLKVFLSDVIKCSASCGKKPFVRSQSSSIPDHRIGQRCWLRPLCTRLISCFPHKHITQDIACLPVLVFESCKQRAKYAAQGVLLNVECVTLLRRSSGFRNNRAKDVNSFGMLAVSVNNVGYGN